MPSGNQNPPRGQGRRNGGSAHGASEPIQKISDQIQEGAAQVGQQLREGYDTTREELTRGYRRVEGTVARNPGSSVLIGFGIGFGLGLVVTTLLTRREETWADRYLPDSIRRVPDSLRDASDAVRQSAPEVLHHLADSIRNLPDAVASRVASAVRR